jgi:hypothetical protein
MVHDARLGFPALALLIAEEMPVLSRRTREPVRFSVEEQEERRKKDVHPVAELREQALPTTRPAASSQGSGIPSPMFKVGDRVRSKTYEAAGWTDLVVIELRENYVRARVGNGPRVGGFFYSDLEHAEGIFKVGDTVRVRQHAHPNYRGMESVIDYETVDGDGQPIYHLTVGYWRASYLEHAEGSKT